MDFTSLLDTWGFRIFTLPIEFIIFYYAGKWFTKRSPLYDEKKLEWLEKYEKKIINWFKGLFIKEKKEGLFYN